MWNSGILAITLLLTTTAFAESKAALRWMEGGPNCTFSIAEDGHIYYGISSEDFEISLGVDRQELEKVQHRPIPMLGFFLSVHYKGNGTFRVGRDKVTLEFVKHRHTVQESLNPSSMLQELDTDADDLTYHVEHQEIRKHPEEKEKKEADLKAHLSDYAELKKFVGGHALRQITLDPKHSSAGGWVFFSTENEWIGTLHRPEPFILRLPAGNWTVEFPFELPPKSGAMELRRRPARP